MWEFPTKELEKERILIEVEKTLGFSKKRFITQCVENSKKEKVEGIIGLLSNFRTMVRK